MHKKHLGVKWILCAGLGVALAGQIAAAAPAITQQPRGTSVLLGSTVTLTVAGTGSGVLTYQWLLNSNAVTGAISPTLTLLNVQKPAGGDYQAVLTDSSGSVTSVVALVNVVAADIPGLTNDLVADYDFEHNLADTSGEGNYASAFGSISFKPTGRTDGSSVEFSTTPDGSSINYIQPPNTDDFTFGPTNDFSVSFWLQSPILTGEFPLIANRDWSNPSNPGWGIALGANGGVRWLLAGPPGTVKSYDGSPNVFADGAWHHVLVVFARSSNATTYFDGAVVDVQALAGNTNDISTPPGLNLNIGQDGTGTFTGGGTAGIDAVMDDLGLWQRALSADEAALIYAKGLRGLDIMYPAFNVSGAQDTRVTGQWDFDQGDLRATVGQDLQYGDATMPGQTSFGTTTSFGIPDIGGVPANVMKYTRNESPPDNYVGGYAMYHGIPPNGGGTLVNQWTLIFDILFPDVSQGDGYSGIIEIQNDPNSDADVSVDRSFPRRRRHRH